MSIHLGAAAINAPRGAIRKGETLTLATGAPKKFPAPGADSLVGGPYAISTSQGEPTKPVKVKFTYNRKAASAGQPLVLHGLDPLDAWVPEETTIAGSSVSASLSSLSPIDVVDSITWAAGDITGNRTDLPTGCGSPPGWIDWLTPPSRRNDSLPACVGSESNDSTLYIHVANNRGYAQFLTVSNATIDVRRSHWSDSFEGLIANLLASLNPGNSPSKVLLAPGSHAVLALDRPAEGFGQTAVSIQAAPQGSSAMAAMGWALIKKVSSELGWRVSLSNCVIAKVSGSDSFIPTASAAVKLLHTCLGAASPGLSEKAKDALKKIGAAVLTVDLFYKLVDLTAGEAYPAGIKFSIRGRRSTNPDIHIGNLNLGSLPAGQKTTAHLSASGGSAPYSFRISHAASNTANVPSWAQLALDGTLTIDPPAGTNESVGFYVYVTDAAGQSSPFERERVTFSVTGEGNTEMGWTASLTPEPSGAYLEGYSWLPSVSCATHGFCVAVGRFPSSQNGYDGLIETLTDEEWTASTAPAPSDAFLQEGNHRNVTLSSVACPSTGACTAVGDYDYNDPTHIQGIGQRALVEELSNGSWTPTVLPLPPDADLQADDAFKSSALDTISCPSGDFCAAAGTYSIPLSEGGDLKGLLATSSGGTWSSSAAPMPADADSANPPSLGSMACSAPGQCVTVGTYSDADGNPHGLIERLSSGTWIATVAPLPADASGDFSELRSAACSPTGFCIAVGWYENGDGDLQGLLDTFSNGTWTATAIPLPPDARAVPEDRIGSNLSAAACSPSGTSCVAAGEYEDIHGNTQGLIHVFDGSSWTTEQAPLPPGAAGGGLIVSATCWAVGSCLGLGFYAGSSEPFGAYGVQGLITTLSNGSWTSIMAPLPESDRGSYTLLERVSCAADGTCAAVGTFETRSNGLSHNRTFLETKQGSP